MKSDNRYEWAANLVAGKLTKEELKVLAVLLDEDADNDFCFYIQAECEKVAPEMYADPLDKKSKEPLVDRDALEEP
jgi:hypothetical protein